MRKSIPMAIFIETRGASLGPPRTHRNEFPAEYSLASCSPAELASAFPAKLILKPWSPFAKKNPANGSCRIYTLSHKRAQSKHAISFRIHLFQQSRPELLETECTE